MKINDASRSAVDGASEAKNVPSVDSAQARVSGFLGTIRDNLTLSKLGAALHAAEPESAQHAYRVHVLATSVGNRSYAISSQQLSESLVDRHMRL